MIFERAHLERALVQRIRECSHDELRVLERVLAGIERGREVYGPLDLSRDARNFRHEGAMEMRDYLFYAAAHEVAADDFERERRTGRHRSEPEPEYVEPEQSIAMPRGPTEELTLCACGHPASLHEEQWSYCLIGPCPCGEMRCMHEEPPR